MCVREITPHHSLSLLNYSLCQWWNTKVTSRCRIDTRLMVPSQSPLVPARSPYPSLLRHDMYPNWLSRLNKMGTIPQLLCTLGGRAQNTINTVPSSLLLNRNDPDHHQPLRLPHDQPGPDHCGQHRRQGGAGGHRRESRIHSPSSLWRLRDRVSSLFQ